MSDVITPVTAPIINKQKTNDPQHVIIRTLDKFVSFSTFLKTTLSLSVSLLLLALILTFVIQCFLKIDSTTKITYLNYGFNSCYKITREILSSYFNNIPNKVIDDYIRKSRIAFNADTERLYKISTLDQWEKDLYTNVSAEFDSTFYKELFVQLQPSKPLDSESFTSFMGYRNDPFKKDTGGVKNTKYHTGLDIYTPLKSNVYSILGGTVVKSSYEIFGLGNRIDIDHGNGLKTIYGHMSKKLVKKGDIITNGQIIGLSGNSGSSTGPHLHFQILYNKEVIDPYYIYEQ